MRVLLSLSKRFLFVANVKSASSSIEQSLAPRAEFAVSETRFGKHENLSAISQKFQWVKRYVPYSDFFVFGVVRDPVDWLLSLYNSHSKADFDGLPYSTKGVPFGRYIREGFDKKWQMRPQHMRFTDEHGRFRASHLIDYTKLDEEFPLICRYLGLDDITLGLANVSPEVLTREDVSDEEIGFIQEKYAADYVLIADRPSFFDACDRQMEFPAPGNRSANADAAPP